MPQPRFVYLISRARHSLMQNLDAQCLQETGITATQLGVLFALKNMDGCRLSDLSQIMGLDNSAMTTMARRMQVAGVIHKLRCKQDGRAWRVHMTAAGHCCVVKGKKALAQVNRQMSEGFSQQEQAICAAFLQQIIDVFEK